MKRWFADTLLKRLFLLIWATLVFSHFAAFMITGYIEHGDSSFLNRVPTLPSLPPIPGLDEEDERGSRGPGGPPPRAEGWGPGGPPEDGGRPHARGERGGRPPDGGPPGQGSHDGQAHDPEAGAGTRFGQKGLSTRGLFIDYGIRLLIIGFGAWLGARWLSGPMRRLAIASQSLGGSLGGPDEAPRLDEKSGTVEVRETARIFNSLADRLRQYLNARSLMVAAISHDLRTPMTRIRMRLEQTPDDQTAARSIADIVEMDDLIDSALVVFKGQDMAEPAQMTNVLALVQSLADDMIDLGQPVSFSSDVDKAVAAVQPVALRRVLCNLLVNAVRYGVRAEVSLTRNDKAIVVNVDDFGPGIPESQIEAVKQPFFRLDASRRRSTGGAGLGLYIAHDLLSRQGCALELSNRAAGGLRAAVSMPL